MNRLLRTIRFDDTDDRVFETAAQPNEWAIPGGFLFAGDTQDTLTGKRRQAFVSGFLGLESFGWSSFVVSAPIDEAQLQAQIAALAGWFVSHHGAPSLEEALPFARDEIGFAVELAVSLPEASVIRVSRDYDPEEGIREGFRQVGENQPGTSQSIWNLFD